jgi:hypothetical protein
MNDIEGTPPVLGYELGERTKPPRLFARIMYLSAQQRPPVGIGLLLQGEDMDLVSTSRQPFDQPQQAGNDSVRTRTIYTPWDNQRDLHTAARIKAS